jgi:hypothetical protein
MPDKQVLDLGELSARSILRFSRVVGQEKLGEDIASELSSSVWSGDPRRVLKCAIEVFVRNIGVGGIFCAINNRLRDVKGSLKPEAVGKAVSSSCGDLSNFVWLAWAGLNAAPRVEGDFFFRAVELQGEALECYREGAVVVWPGFSS